MDSWTMELLDSSSDVLSVIVNWKRAFRWHFQTIHHLFEAFIVHESKISFKILKNNAIPNYIGINAACTKSPKRAKRLQTGVSPPVLYTNIRKPCKGESWSFVPSALRLVVSMITGIIIPARGLVSLSGLCLTRRYFPLRFPQWFLALAI